MNISTRLFLLALLLGQLIVVFTYSARVKRQLYNYGYGLGNGVQGFGYGYGMGGYLYGNYGGGYNNNYGGTDIGSINTENIGI
uniref:Uncharacterized protein n=1 Tax=Parascaris univalens TaxID=6257 RepID=A0A915C3P8_PARUN